MKTIVSEFEKYLELSAQGSKKALAQLNKAWDMIEDSDPDQAESKLSLLLNLGSLCQNSSESFGPKKHKKIVSLLEEILKEVK